MSSPNAPTSDSSTGNQPTDSSNSSDQIIAVLNGMESEFLRFVITIKEANTDRRYLRISSAIVQIADKAKAFLPTETKMIDIIGELIDESNNFIARLNPLELPTGAFENAVAFLNGFSDTDLENYILGVLEHASRETCGCW
jgi:hypothetical protein